MLGDSSNTIKVLFAGLLLGAAFGVLFAPEKGKKTRKKIKKKIAQGKIFLTQEAEDIVDSFMNNFEEIEQQLESTVKDVIHEGKEKTAEIITILEEKLTQLKQKSNPNT